MQLLISAAPDPDRAGDDEPFADSGEPPSLARPPAEITACGQNFCQSDA